MFLNLVLNSCQAMPTGGTITVRTRRASAGGNRNRNVRHGTWNSSQRRNTMFDPFFTTRLAEGTGLGLSVSLRIIQDHDGEIRLIDRQGGATFVVSLPQAVPDDARDMPTSDA